MTTTQVVKQLSTGQSWLPDWTREVSAKVNSYQSGRLCVGGHVNQAITRMWSLINQAATKIWGRDLQEPVSSLVLAMATEASPDLSYGLVCPVSQGSPSLRGTIVPKQSRRGMGLPRLESIVKEGIPSRLEQIRGEMGLTSRTTISAHGAFSTGRVAVGRGR